MDRYTCDIEGFSATMETVMFNLENNIKSAARTSVRKSVTWGAKELRTSSKTPVRKTGKLADGWYKAGFTGSTYRHAQGDYGVIHNKNAPGLVHLLEKGHATIGGGRVRAYPHVAPVADETFKRFWEDIQDKVGGAL